MARTAQPAAASMALRAAGGAVDAPARGSRRRRLSAVGFGGRQPASWRPGSPAGPGAEGYRPATICCAISWQNIRTSFARREVLLRVRGNAPAVGLDEAADHELPRSAAIALHDRRPRAALACGVSRADAACHRPRKSYIAARNTPRWPRPPAPWRQEAASSKSASAARYRWSGPQSPRCPRAARNESSWASVPNGRGRKAALGRLVSRCAAARGVVSVASVHWS